MGVSSQLCRISIWLLSVAFLAPSAPAITIANSSYSATINTSNPLFKGVGQSATLNLSGVVQVNIAGEICSGALLSNGTSILTAGHCVDGGTIVSPSAVTITFPGVSTTYTAQQLPWIRAGTEAILHPARIWP